MNKARKLKVGTKADALNIVAAYTFNETNSMERDYSGQTLGFWGEEREVKIQHPDNKSLRNKSSKIVIGDSINNKVSITENIVRTFKP